MTAPPSPPAPSPPAAAPGRAARIRRLRHARYARFRALVRASGGPRGAGAVTAYRIGADLARPSLIVTGTGARRLPALTDGLVMTVGVAARLGCSPAMSRWLDRGTRSTAVAASML